MSSEGKVETRKLLEAEATEEERDNESLQEDAKPMLQRIVTRVWEVIRLRRGVLYSGLCGCALGLQFVAVSCINHVSPYQIFFYRCLPFLFSVAMISWDESMFYNAYDMFYYASYGVLNSSGILLSYVGLQFAHAGNVASISSNLPIPAAILGLLLLSEKITCFDIFLFTLNVIGLVCVARPPFIFRQENFTENRYEFLGALIAFGGLISFVLSIIASRKLAYRKNSDPALQTFFPGVTGLLTSGIVLSVTQMWTLPASLQEGLMCSLVAILSLLGNIFVVLGLKYERVIVCSVLVTVSVPVSFLAGILVLHQVPDVYSVIGAVLIVGSTFGCLFRPE